MDELRIEGGHVVEVPNVIWCTGLRGRTLHPAHPDRLLNGDEERARRKYLAHNQRVARELKKLCPDI